VKSGVVVVVVKFSFSSSFSSSSLGEFGCEKFGAVLKKKLLLVGWLVGWFVCLFVGILLDFSRPAPPQAFSKLVSFSLFFWFWETVLETETSFFHLSFQRS
jgi:hypothetical protein